MKLIILLFVLSACALPTIKPSPKIYHLDITGLYRSQNNEVIPMTDPRIPFYFCLDRLDLIELLKSR